MLECEPSRSVPGSALLFEPLFPATLPPAPRPPAFLEAALEEDAGSCMLWKTGGREAAGIKAGRAPAAMSAWNARKSASVSLSNG